MKRTMILISALVLLATPLTFANPNGCGPGMGMGMGKAMCMGPCPDMGGKGDCCDGIQPGMLLRMADEIGLDANQKAQLEKMTQEFGLTRIDKQAELEKAELRLRHLMMNDGPEKDILAAMDKAGLLRTEMQKMRFQHMRQVKAVLTADQLKKVKELMPKMQCGSDTEEDAPGIGMGKCKIIKMEMNDEQTQVMKGPGCNRPCGLH
jgi:Spy/CpxP family protein refolding chaperone